MKISKVTENFALKIFEFDYIFFAIKVNKMWKLQKLHCFFVKAIQNLVHFMYFSNSDASFRLRFVYFLFFIRGVII